MSIGIPCSLPFSRAFSFLSAKTYQGTFFVFSQNAPSKQFKSNVRETWRVILVSEADIFLSESLRILAERLSQSEIGLPLRQICYYSPPEEVGVFSTEIKPAAGRLYPPYKQSVCGRFFDFIGTLFYENRNTAVPYAGSGYAKEYGCPSHSLLMER